MQDEAGSAPAEDLQSDPANWQVVVMLPVKPPRPDSDRPTPEPLTSSAAVLIPIPVSLQLVVAISTERVQLPLDVRPVSERQVVLASLAKLVHNRHGGPRRVPELDPVEDLQIEHPKVKLACEEVARLKVQLFNNVIFQKEQGDASDQEEYEQLKDMATERMTLQTKVARSQLTEFQNEVKMRLRVLKRLGHFDSVGMLTAKGKSAAEVRTVLSFSRSSS